VHLVHHIRLLVVQDTEGQQDPLVHLDHKVHKVKLTPYLTALLGHKAQLDQPGHLVLE
jgi:hypothetical protein